MNHTILAEIANQYGTPLYVYHAEKIADQYKKLTGAFSGIDTRFFYACKALTNISVLKYIRSLGCNIDCSSINEVHLALKAGFEPVHILYTSNGIAFDEIITAVELGVNINIDSLSNLEKFGAQFGSNYPVGIRLLPNIMAGGNLKISTGHENSKFGIPVHQLNQILSLAELYQLQIVGLHIHTGSEIKDLDVFMKVANIFFDLASHFPALRFLDMGGGFKVPYQDHEEGTDMNLLAQKLGEALRDFEFSCGKSFQVWFEPGKFLVSEAGSFITKVNVLKTNGSIHFAGVNSGFNHLIRPMFYEAFHRITNISNTEAPAKEYAVVGNICETDTFAWNRPLNEVREGDLLVFHNAGAYGFEMGSNYNSRFLPAQVLYKNEQAHLIRKRDELSDLLRNQIELD